MRPAIGCGAKSVILAHKPPSDDPTPSDRDEVLTARFIDCGQMLDISIIDHTVIGEGDEYWSLRNRWTDSPVRIPAPPEGLWGGPFSGRLIRHRSAWMPRSRECKCPVLQDQVADCHDVLYLGINGVNARSYRLPRSWLAHMATSSWHLARLAAGPERPR